MPRILKAVFVLLCLAGGLALPGPALAQSHPGGAIQGTVTDESGAVLPGVTVTIRNQKTGVVRETHSDSLGLYRAPLLPVGVYELAAALPGFAGLKRPERGADASARFSPSTSPSRSREPRRR